MPERLPATQRVRTFKATLGPTTNTSKCPLKPKTLLRLPVLQRIHDPLEYYSTAATAVLRMLPESINILLLYYSFILYDERYVWLVYLYLSYIHTESQNVSFLSGSRRPPSLRPSKPTTKLTTAGSTAGVCENVPEEEGAYTRETDT